MGTHPADDRHVTISSAADPEAITEKGNCCSISKGALGILSTATSAIGAAANILRSHVLDEGLQQEHGGSGEQDEDQQSDCNDDVQHGRSLDPAIKTSSGGKRRHRRDHRNERNLNRRANRKPNQIVEP